MTEIEERNRMLAEANRVLLLRIHQANEMFAMLEKCGDSSDALCTIHECTQKWRNEK